MASIFGWKRNILSGKNNRHDDGTPTVGDVRVPAEYRHLNIECKVRRKFAIVNLFNTVRDEHPEKVCLLFVHEARQLNEDSLVVLNVATFRQLWQYAGEHFAIKEKEELSDYDDPAGLFSGEAQTPPQTPKPKRPKRASKTKKADS